MSNWKISKISEFLFEREGHYKPDAVEISTLERLSKIDFSGVFHIADKPSKTDMILIKPGDLVISGINVAKGALGIYEGKKDITATIHYSSYTFDEKKISVEYFKRFLKSPIFSKLLKAQVKGGIKTEIKPKHLLSLKISLPPKDKQLEILSKFEQIESEDKELKSEISYQQALVKKLRQQILQEAIEGKLTADWRAKNPNIESASELLKRIASEKEQLIKDKKIKTQRNLSFIIKEEEPYSLPPGWAWCRLQDIIYEPPRNGHSPKAVNFKTEVKTLKLGATTKGFFDPLEFKYIAEVIEPGSYLWLEKNDILIQRSNSPEHVGVSALYDGGSHCFIYPDLMMKIKVVKTISPDFIHKVLSSPFCRKYYRKKAKGAQKSMPKINQATVSKTLIPLPPQQEQEMIIKNLGLVEDICTELDKQITLNQLYAEQLMQAVLKETFS